MDTEGGTMGNCELRRKCNTHCLSWHFDSTGGFSLKLVCCFFFSGKVHFKSTQCGLGCLHSGVSRTLELYLKGIVLMFCVFLSDSPNTREFGIILDLE